MIAKRLTRRDVVKRGLAGAAVLVTSPSMQKTRAQAHIHKIRLGGPVFEKYKDPDQWIQALKKLGYGAAYCPVGADAADDVVKAYEVAAKKAGIVIAEVGAWSNPISTNEEQRQAALKKCRQQLALADRIGANCCVNVSGSRGPEWAGPSEKNFTPETFDLIVEATRSIIDAVKPTRTFFTLETMPWAYPDSADSYLKLWRAIDRKRFAVHLDPTNLICSPQRYYRTGQIIRECFAKLGPYIKSCHAKDIRLDAKLMTHLDEVRIGLGNLDYVTFLKELSKAGDIPLMMEHLPNAEEYRLAAEQVRRVANAIGLSVV